MEPSWSGCAVVVLGMPDMVYRAPANLTDAVRRGGASWVGGVIWTVFFQNGFPVGRVILFVPEPQAGNSYTTRQEGIVLRSRQPQYPRPGTLQLRGLPK